MRYWCRWFVSFAKGNARTNDKSNLTNMQLRTNQNPFFSVFASKWKSKYDMYPTDRSTESIQIVPNDEIRRMYLFLTSFAGGQAKLFSLLCLRCAYTNIFYFDCEKCVWFLSIYRIRLIVNVLHRLAHLSNRPITAHAYPTHSHYFSMTTIDDVVSKRRRMLWDVLSDLVHSLLLSMLYRLCFFLFPTNSFIVRLAMTFTNFWVDEKLKLTNRMLTDYELFDFDFFFSYAVVKMKRRYQTYKNKMNFVDEHNLNTRTCIPN